MPRPQNDPRKPQETNPVQRLESQVQQIKHEDQGPVPPPQPPAEQPPLAESPSPQGSFPIPEAETPHPELPPQPEVVSQTPVQQLPPEPQPEIPLVESSRPQMIQQSNLPAAQSLLFQVMNAQRTQNQKFHLVIVPDDDHPRVRSFDQVEDMIEAMQEYLDTPTSLFPFLGDLMRISKGPNRYLQTPFGVMPLFVLPKGEELEFESDGFVGQPTKELAAPEMQEDEEDDDEDEPEDDATMTTGTQPPPALMQEDDDTPVLPATDG